ncbi:unnamed protein product, partial [Dibothriocephalus latus]
MAEMFDIPMDRRCLNNCEWIRKAVECEGVQARNIIKYNVPINDKQAFLPAFLQEYRCMQGKASPPVMRTRTPSDRRSGPAKISVLQTLYTCSFNATTLVEVIMILKHSEHDFKALIEKMSLLRRYESSAVENRPQCLAWDERKISPGKPIMHRVLAEGSSHGGQTSLITASPAMTARTLATDEDDFDFGTSGPATGRREPARCGKTNPIDIAVGR